MTRLFWLIILLLLPSAVWAESLYTKPPSVCANNGDGSTAACAASLGAPGAFRGVQNVPYGAGGGSVSNGDTLYICGYHDGGSPLDDAIIPTTNAIIDGACPSDPGTFLAVFHKFTSGWTGPDAFGAYSQAASGNPYHLAQSVAGVVTYLNVKKAAVPDGTWIAGDWFLSAGTYYVKPLGGVDPNTATIYTENDNGIVLTNVAVTIQNLTMPGLVYNDCIQLNNADWSIITGNTIAKCSLDAIAIWTASDYAQVTNNNISMAGNGIYVYSVTTANNSNHLTVTGNTIHDLDQSRFFFNFTSDNHAIGVQGGDDNLFSLNTISHVAGTAITLYTEAGQSMKRTQVTANSITDIRDTSALSPLLQYGIEVGSTNAAHVANDVVDNVVAGNLLTDVTRVCFYTKSSLPTVGQRLTWTNNTGVRCGTGLYMEDAEDGNIGFYFKNTILLNATTNIDHLQNGTDTLTGIVINTNVYYPDGASSFEWNGTKSAFAAWKTNSSQDAASSIANPLLTSTYRTPGNSPLRRAGEAGLFCIDVRGRPCWSPPDIGAYQASGGDQANTRYPRTVLESRTVFEPRTVFEAGQ